MNDDGTTHERGEPPYYILHGKDAFGPYTVDEIRDQLLDGTLTAVHYAWNHTMAEWLPLSQIFDITEIEPLAEGKTSLHPPAGFGRRFVAGLVDLLLIMIIFQACVFLLPQFRELVETASTDPAQWLELNLLLSGFVYLYYMLMLARPGQGATVGYLVMKLRLVDQATRAQPGWTHCLLWCIGSMVLPIGWVLYWFDTRRRMLHNVVSQTLVIDLRVP